MKTLPPTLGFLALVAACVPTEPEKDPRGGVSVTFLPSEATAGVPFQTNDGWTVTIEKTALRAQAGATPQNLGLGGYGSGSQPRVFDPRYQCELRATGLSPGPALVFVTLQTFDPKWGEQIHDEDVCAIDALTLRRFKTYADDVVVTPDLLSLDSYEYENTPGFYVKATAAKNGRVLSFDWALGVSTSPPDFGTYDDNGTWKPTTLGLDDAVNVVVNEGVPARFEVHFESFFAGGIDPIAASDTNNDGVVTADELRAMNLACQTYGTYSSSSSSSGYAGDDDDDSYGDDDYGYGSSGYPKKGGSQSGSETQCQTLLDQLILQASTVMAKTPRK